MERHDIVEGTAEPRADFQHAGRRVAAVDFRVAFVEGGDEIVPPGERDEPGQVFGVGRGALRIGRIAQIDQRRAAQHVLADAFEIGQEVVLRRGGDVDGLAAGHHRRTLVDVVGRIGHQDGGPFAVRPILRARHGQLRDLEQAFLRSRQGQQVARRLQHALRQPETARQPTGRRVPERRRAARARIFVPEIAVFGQGRIGKRGLRQLRFAQMHQQRRHAGGRRRSLQKNGELLEGIVEQMIDATVFHCSPECRSSCMNPHFSRRLKTMSLKIDHKRLIVLGKAPDYKPLDTTYSGIASRRT